MLTELWLILGLVGLTALLWQFKKQQERALLLIQQYCRKHQLQYLDIARESSRLRTHGRLFGLWSCYRFGFSSDTEHRYEGELEMLNLRLITIKTPPYRLPAEQ
ncbi:DUF3301 domain-containing protein [Pseudidiomarina taiwanensis]|uniref:DUF3301 domain-containing protein n=1 Tax=Pseudidiomarina taiwanensis TaxID=337250 RepID=A0A432ZNQ9_9GAMM|nr:DUF3301 domain-containing protein [Pseudidiomarina taiwanensis]RUO79498.1 DUF3301 domain-containing protein [Pseudidiomarina taiwanensis]